MNVEEKFNERATQILARKRGRLGLEIRAVISLSMLSTKPPAFTRGGTRSVGYQSISVLQNLKQIIHADRNIGPLH